MADLTDVVVEDPRWDGIDLSTLAGRAAEATLARLGITADGIEIVVLGTDDARIAALNAEFRGKPEPTNVLSWPAEDLSPEEDGASPDLPHRGTPDDPESLGDIALAWETCAREAEAAGKPLAHHATHLVVHGTLHLLGYDHVRDGDAERMEGLEEAILASLGVPSPY